MAKFKCTVYREDEYEIEFDENVINVNFISEFSRFFHKVDGIEEMAEDLAQRQARLEPTDAYFEGYGYVKINGEFKGSQKKGNEAINIKIINQDNYCHVNVDKVEEKEESCQ